MLTAPSSLSNTQQILMNHYHGLSTNQKNLMRLLAVAFYPLTRTQLVMSLQSLGTGLTGVEVKPLLVNLQEIGLVQSNHDSVRCNPEIAEILTRAAVRDGGYARLAQTASRNVRSAYTYGFDFAVSEIRHAFYRKDFPVMAMRLQQAYSYYPLECVSRDPLQQLLHPFDAEWLDEIPDSFSNRAVSRYLKMSFDTMVSTEPALSWLQGSYQKSADRRYRYALESLLRGEVEEADAALAGQNLPFMRMLQGWVALADGKLDSALQLFDASLKEYRAHSRRKKSILPEMGGLVYVFALLESNRPVHVKQALSYLAAMQSMGEKATTIAASLISDIAALRQGHSVRKEDTPHPALAPGVARWLVFFYGLREYWRDADDARRLVPPLDALHRDARQAGYNGFASEVGALLNRLAPESYAAPPNRLHRLIDMMPQQPAWERTLAALGAICSKAPEGKRRGAIRIGWFLGTDALTLEAREQKQDARGKWKEGKVVSLKRLHEDGAAMEHLTPQDRQVCQCIRGERPMGLTAIRYTFDIGEALKALVGHTAVFSADEPHLPLQVLPGEPELRVEKKATTLDISLHPRPRPGQEVAIVAETETRIRVISFTDEHHKIARLLEGGLQVPSQARQVVAEAIAPLSAALTIHSDLDLGTASAREVPPDSALYANLVPCQGGLKVRLVAQPLGPDGPALIPGRGGATVMAEVNGQRVQAQRDLPGERKLLAQIQSQCPTLATAEELSGEWIVRELEECLELLSELRAQSPLVVARWPEGQSLKLAGEATWKDARIRIERQRDWFVANGEVSLDDGTVLDLQRLLILAGQGHGRFIPLGDGQFFALTDEFRRRLLELRTCADEHGKTIRLHPLAAPAVERITSGAGSLQSDPAWKAQVHRLHEVSEAAVPSTLQAELRPYQEEGFRWLDRLSQWGVGACLADDMGLGKTLQALAVMLQRAADGPALVVAPASVCINWINEAHRFAPTLRPRFFGNGDRQAILSSAGPRDLVVCSYGLLHQESEALASVRWHTLVLDEAQAIKNVATRRSHAAKALQADFRLVTTGTPVENHVGELWNLFDFLNPGLLGSQESFNRRFAGPMERASEAEAGGVAESHTARSVLKQMIQPYILRRLKSQVLQELPPRTEILLQVEPSTEEQGLLEALRRQAVDRLDSSVTSTGENHLRILAEIMKLRRACCHPRLVLPDTDMVGSKLAVFTDLVEELRENRHRALVFSQFVDHLAILRAALEAKGVAYQYLDGSTPLPERQKRVDAFQSGQGDVFLISLRAGGVGLNLTAADYVIHMDPWWNPAVEDQAADRAHRIGQLRPVTIYRLVLKGSIEEQIVALHREKRDLADHLLEGTDTAGKLSADELLRLLKGV